MLISARNVFKGTVSAVVNGAVNAEIELTLPGGDKIVAIVTESSVVSLGLAVGQPAIAYAKAPWVILISGTPEVRFSARNQLAGTVASVTKGAVNSEVALDLAGGTTVYSVITNEAAHEMGLAPGSPATALIKASHLVLGVPI